MGKNTAAFMCVFLITFVTLHVSAFDVTRNVPTFQPRNPNHQPAVDALTSHINGAVQNITDESLEFLGNPNPVKGIRSMADASVISSHTATQRVFNDYRLFNATVGTMWGFVIEPNAYAPGVTEDDLSVGINPQLLNAQIGLNLDFLVPNLTAAFRFGYMNLNNIANSFSFNSLALGLLVNYQLLPPVNLDPQGYVFWRGINIGSGIVYQRTHFENDLKYYGQMQLRTLISGSSDFNELLTAPALGRDPTLTIANPTLNLVNRINTVTIPLEVVSSVRFLHFFNMAFGVGVDLGFGRSERRVIVEGDLLVEGINRGLVNQVPGNIRFSDSGSVEPHIFNFKIIGGIGFNLGHVIIDFPVSFYPRNLGYQTGFTLGIAY